MSSSRLFAWFHENASCCFTIATAFMEHRGSIKKLSYRELFVLHADRWENDPTYKEYCHAIAKALVSAGFPMLANSLREDPLKGPTREELSALDYLYEDVI